MAVRRGKRRGRRHTKPPSAQKSWYNLVASLGALIMVIALGDQFASSAAGCYGAVSQTTETKPQSEKEAASTTRDEDASSSPESPTFIVREPDTTGSESISGREVPDTSP